MYRSILKMPTSKLCVQQARHVHVIIIIMSQVRDAVCFKYGNKIQLEQCYNNLIMLCLIEVIIYIIKSTRNQLGQKQTLNLLEI